jgi:hypothetical protein
LNVRMEMNGRLKNSENCYMPKRGKSPGKIWSEILSKLSGHFKDQKKNEPCEQEKK